jgi:hypothetical protein
MALYTLPKIYSPDFANPNTQPQGAITVESKYGKNDIYLPKNSGLFNVRNGVTQPYSNTDFIHDIAGGVTEMIDTTSLTNVPTNVSAASGALLFRFKLNDDTADTYLFDSIGQRHLLLFLATGKTFLYQTDSVTRFNIAQSLLPPLGEYYNLGITWPESELWINGVLVTTGSTGALGSIGSTYKIGNRFTDNQALDGNIAFVALLNPNAKNAIAHLTKHPYDLLEPQIQQTYSTAEAAGGITLTGTAVPTQTEADIVTGGKTIILTLAGDTFVTGTSSEDGIAGGSDSDKTGANKWDALIKTALDNTDVVLSVGDTVATITLPSFATYDTDETETITWTIPAASLTTGTSDIIATPTHTVTAVVSGRVMGSLANNGGLAGMGGLAGRGGGMAG